MASCDLGFRCMGTEVRLVVEGRGAPDAADDARAWLHEADRRLSRFRPDSELSALNADPRPAVPGSPLLRAAVGAALWAAERTGGLVDPTLLGALRTAGYAESLAGRAPASLADALAAAPPRAPATRHPGAAWRRVVLRDGDDCVHRPPGLGLDTGGTTKGLAADAVAHRMRRAERFAVDCGGDLRLGGDGTRRRPFEIEVEHPLTGEPVDVLRVAAGGVATSGLGARLWTRPGGGYAHHLLDPATGEPAWTGPDLRHRARADRARGRDPGQGGAALRPGSRASVARVLRRPPRPRRRRRRDRRPMSADHGPGPRGAGAMTAAEPLAHGWWLASRAAGVVALLLLALTVGLGLTMAGRLDRRPGATRRLRRLHEDTALVALSALAVHALTLLGDPWLHPGAAGLAVPFTMAYRPCRDGPRRRRRLRRGAARPVVLRPHAHRAPAVAAAAPPDDRRLRPRGPPRAAGRDRRRDPVAAGGRPGDRAPDRGAARPPPVRGRRRRRTTATRAATARRAGATP